MSEELNKIINKLFEKYSSKLSKNEIIEIVKCDDAYEDMPLSTGKRLIVEFVSFNGIKTNGEQINYQEKFSSGLNMIIGDNLKGKSTIFKIIKTALVGDDGYIKKDVRQWIKNIIVGFKINEKRYTIFMDMEKRVNGILYNCSFENYLAGDNINNKIIFEANSNVQYTHEIQKFFFNQFSYYSLKWTQKTSSKDSNELVEAGSSWKTYFKTIYLESQDSTSFYGNQDQKTFQMLLGLENTQLINRLIIKKEMLQSQLGKCKEFEEHKSSQTNEPFSIENQLEEIGDQLKSLRQHNTYVELINLQNKRNEILKQLNDNNNKLDKLYKEHKNIMSHKDLRQKEYDEYDREHRRISKEIIKSKKLLIDIKEYLEVGQFFSELDIKFCPSCYHEIYNHEDVHSDVCPLCHETVISEKDNKHNYDEKMLEIESTLQGLEQERDLLKEKINNIESELNKLQLSSENSSNMILDLKKNVFEERLVEITSLIEKFREKNSDIQENEKELIAKQAVLQYRKQEVERNYSGELNISKLEISILVLQDAVAILDKKRFENSKTILDDLKKCMLEEIHNFGLTSILDIKIDQKFNITYIQNGIEMKFQEIAEGEQLRAKLAFYLSLIQFDVEKNYGRHTHFLIIDSPNKEEGDNSYLQGLREVLIQIQKKYRDNLQILIGTATREFSGAVDKEKIYQEGEYLF
uniref:Nuclease SbcCD subunit C n=1 Tax=Listeria monocytogenes TaxID=1639 RepID=A0A5M2PQY7_LISMN